MTFVVRYIPHGTALPIALAIAGASWLLIRQAAHPGIGRAEADWAWGRALPDDCGRGRRCCGATERPFVFLIGLAVLAMTALAHRRGSRPPCSG